jgi:hypothetical protein
VIYNSTEVHKFFKHLEAKFHTEHPHILGANVQNLVVRDYLYTPVTKRYKFSCFHHAFVVLAVVLWIVSLCSLIEKLLMFRRNVVPPSSLSRRVGVEVTITQSFRLRRHHVTSECQCTNTGKTIGWQNTENESLNHKLHLGSYRILLKPLWHDPETKHQLLK